MDKFAILDDTAAELVERSRHSNALHCRAVNLGRKLEAVCNDGLKDSLDPNCVKVFERSLQYAYEIMKMSMTEMQGHMAKGKWG